MNAAGTRAPEAAGAEGTRLAPSRSSSPRRRGRPEKSPAAATAAAAGGADERPAAGAPPRFPFAPPPRPHPAAASGPASGWLRRRWCWAALLVFGLLVAGAADGCELVSRHLRGRRASGSAAAAVSSHAAAAGDSPALMTGEGPGCGGRGEAGCCGTPIPGRGPYPCWVPARLLPRAVRGAERGAQTPAPWPLLGRGPLQSGRLSPPTPTPDTPPSTEPLDGTRFSALQSGSPVFLAEQCGGFSSVLQKSQQGVQGTGLIFFFFFLKLLQKVSAALRYLVCLWCSFCKGSWQRVSQVQSLAEHNVPGEAAKEDSLRAVIPNGISGSVLVCGNL